MEEVERRGAEETVVTYFTALKRRVDNTINTGRVREIKRTKKIFKKGRKKEKKEKKKEKKRRKKRRDK